MKRTLEEVTSEARKIYGDKYDYSLIKEYKNGKTKYPIICPIHGVFYKSFDKHIYSKQGCPKCSGKKQYTTEEFIQKCKNTIDTSNYSFEKVQYVNNKTKVIVTCHCKDENGNEHGDFEISPNHLLSGEGCPKCRYIKSANGRRRTLDEIISKAREIHGDKYDYSLIKEYKNDRIKYPIICPIHGVFYTTMNNHIQGKQGCPKCAIEDRANKRKLTNEEYIEKANAVHDNKYVYSLVNYEGYSKPITIICPIHGKFIQNAGNHLNGQGCPECGKQSAIEKSILTKEEFVEKAKKIHGDKYDYSMSIYKGIINPIEIKCPIHGNFWQKAGNHLQGNGCPKCANNLSKGENEIAEYLESILGKDAVITRDRLILKGKELDIYIPSFKIAIEFDGLFWHSDAIKNDRNYHLDKTKECEKLGIRLIHIFEDEWTDKKEIVKSLLRSIFQSNTNRIYARKCDIREVNSKDSMNFLNENHMQGGCGASVHYGLYYNNELVSLMTFGKSRHFIGNNGDKWELIRFCSKRDTTVIGGASKLFKHFIDEYKPNEVISYADKRYSVGNLYDKLRFKKYSESRPNYYYIIGNKRVYRFNLRKSVLIKKYGCPKDKTEREFCQEKGWHRIYDCGTLGYVWKNNNR